MKNNKEAFKEILNELGRHTMHRTMSRYFQFARKQNLSFSQMMILNKLFRTRGASVTELSAMLDISNSAVSQLLDKMVQAGLAERREDPEDRRRKRHFISPKGKAVVKQSIDARTSWGEEMAEGLTEEEMEFILPGLERFVQRIKEMDPLPDHHFSKKHEEEE